MPSTKVNVYFRADGNETIGLGHIVRCTALAEMIAPEFTAVFVLRKSTAPAIRMVSQAGFQYTMIEEEESFFSLLNSTNIAVTDGYEFDEVYFEKIIQTGARLVCIDDMVNTYYPAHLVINQNPAYTPQDYKAAPYTQFAIGLDYALLRKPFRQAVSLHKKAVKNGKYLIAMGGVDPLDISKNCIDTLLSQVAPEQITLLISSGKSTRYQTEYPMIKVVHSLSADSMCSLMLQHQFLICPASSVSIEGLCVGMELICGYYADNQKKFQEYLASNGYIINSGNFLHANLLEDAIKKTRTGKYELRSLIVNPSNFTTLINSAI